MDDEADRQVREDSDAGARPAGTTLGSHFVAAVALAVGLHKDRRRKGSTIPYVAHLLGVCSLVLEHGGNEDEAVAARLLVAAERNGTSGTRVQIELPLPAGDYSAEVFETRGDAAGLRLRLA